MTKDAVRIEHDGPVTVVTIDRPHARNAVDRPTAQLLADAFRAFEADDDRSVAILTGANGMFCAGADLKAVGEGRGNAVRDDGDGPMGPTRMLLSKPVIAAVEGYAVAGGLELAIWCDLRVAASDAVFGVFCRRWGVPLVDGGTVRLPRLIGHSHALDHILTGPGVSGDEAMRMGLVNRMTEPGRALDGARALAHELAVLPPRCLREDKLSSYEQWGAPIDEAIMIELRHAQATLASGESLEGAIRFAEGAGRHGAAAPRTNNAP
jgi:enoyl-CoA hydratase